MDIFAVDILAVGLLLVISAVSMATRLVRLPYPIALVLTGLGLALLMNHVPILRDLPLSEIQLTPRLILVLFLPALLFESTLHIEAPALRRTLLPIALLAIPGVLLTAGIVGALVHWSVGLDWFTALLFGALISATDPIAVVAIFKRLGAPHELEVLVEGESLFNDGTAVVLSRIMLGAVLAGTFDLAAGGRDFVLVVGGGLVLGLATGAVMSRLIARIDDHLIEITLTTILTYGTFIAAEAIHVSGVIAVVAAGLVLGNVGARRGMSPVTRLALLTFWEYVAFLLNSVIFLLIGLQIDLGLLQAALLPMGIAVGAALLARAVVVYGFGPAILRSVPSLSPGSLHPLFWAGLRGAVSLAVVLSLPTNLPMRPLLLTMTFGVVLFTLLVQGLMMGPLLRWSGVAKDNSRHQATTARQTQLLMLRAAWHELQQLADTAVLSRRAYTQFDSAYRAASQQLDSEIDALAQGASGLEDGDMRAIQTRLLQIEQATLDMLHRQGLVDVTVARELAEAVDARRLAIQSGSDGDLSGEQGARTATDTGDDTALPSSAL